MLMHRNGPRGVGLMALACVAALVLQGGCGDATSSASSSSEEATVHGTVTIKGKRASSGKVRFNSANVYRKGAKTAEAEIGKDGTYNVKTLVGSNEITVDGREIARYPDLVRSRLRHEVNSGDNTFDIVIPPR